VLRGLQLFDEIIIGIGHNINKRDAFPLEERINAIQHAFNSEPRIKVMAYDGLTVDFAAEQHAQFILRGVRSVQDFEYERNIAEANKQLSGIETILLYTRPEYAHISSTLLRDLHAHGKDISPYLP
jgi:pantetheine-phosphate adenylyltransferase